MKKYSYDYNYNSNENQDTMQNIHTLFKVISFNEAISSWSMGKDINCYIEEHGYTYRFKGKDLILQDYFYSVGITKAMIHKGIWYILD